MPHNAIADVPRVAEFTPEASDASAARSSWVAFLNEVNDVYSGPHVIDG